MTALFIAFGLVVYLTACCLIGLLCSGDTTRTNPSGRVGEASAGLARRSRHGCARRQVRTGMKALTLWQPYAQLLATGVKTIETRSWPAPAALIGERIAIHAAARKPDMPSSFEAFVACPECGDDAVQPAPCARMGDPDFGEYECSTCEHQFKPHWWSHLHPVAWEAMHSATSPPGGRLALPLGAVVGSAVLTMCLPMVDRGKCVGPPVLGHPKHVCLALDAPEPDDRALLVTHMHDIAKNVEDQLPFGIFEPGRWAWVFTDAEQCEPVPARGAQRVWNWRA